MKLVSRERAIRDLEFASFISEWQNIGNPVESNYMREEGEYYDDVIDDVRFFPQSELDDIYQKEVEEHQRLIDEKPKIDSKLYGKIVIDAPEGIGDIEYLTNVFVKLVELHELKLLFIPLYKTNWFNEENIKHHHRTTKTAYKKFKKFIGKDDYSGGFELSLITSIRHFLPILFKLVQSNYLTYNFFYSEDLKTVFSYHYTGQIWFYCLSKEGLKHIEKFITSNKLIVNKEYTTHNNVHDDHAG
jgi:hypothetical protein